MSSSENQLIESEDLERLRRLSSAAGGLLETNYNNQLVEETFARLGKYKDLFLSLSQRVSECNSKHQAQQQAVNGLESRLKQNQNDLAETKARLNRAVDESDVDTASLLNPRLPASQLVIDNLETKLEEARQELARRWLLFDGARGQVDDLRREVDQQSGGTERVLGILESQNDPVLNEDRARHRKLLDPSAEARSLAQPEESKVL